MPGRECDTQTFHALESNIPSQLIGGAEEDLDVADEALRDKDAFDVGSVANVEEHVRDTRGGRLLESRKDAPYFINFLLHDFLFVPDSVALLNSRVRIRIGGLQWLASGSKADVPELVDHVTFGVPVLILTVAEDLDELL